MNLATLENETPRPQGGEIQFPPYLTPIRFSDFTPETLKALIGGRRLFLRGAAFMGQGFASSLSRHGLEIEAFIDKSPRLRGRRLAGRPVYTPEEIYDQPDLARKIFVIMTSGYWEEEFRPELAAAGLAEGRDFISSFDLAPLNPSIDIAGVCNLRCQGCPRGNMNVHPPVGFMSAEVYAQVIDKILREMPFLGQIQLYTWGEPLLNRELPEIIGHNKARRVLSIVSTNLNLKPELVESMARAKPEVVRVSCSGWGANYEITHTGGKWDLFLKNLKYLAELNRSLRAGMEMELYYHLYRHNGGEDYEKIKALAEDLDYVFRPQTATLYPRDNVVALRLGQPITREVSRQMEMINEDAKYLLMGDFNSETETRCLENRYFSINWNLNVRACGVSYLPMVADNFLEVSLPELVRRVAEGEACARCAGAKAHCFVKNFMVDQRSLKEN